MGERTSHTNTLIQSIPSLLKNVAPGRILPASDCHPASSVTESSKGHSVVLASQVLRMVASMEWPWILPSWVHYCPSSAMKHIPWPGATRCGTPCQWVKHSIKSKDSRFSEGTVCREGNYVSRAGVYYWHGTEICVFWWGSGVHGVCWALGPSSWPPFRFLNTCVTIWKKRTPHLSVFIPSFTSFFLPGLVPQIISLGISVLSVYKSQAPLPSPMVGAIQSITVPSILHGKSGSPWRVKDLHTDTAGQSGTLH